MTRPAEGSGPDPIVRRGGCPGAAAGRVAPTVTPAFTPAAGPAAAPALAPAVAPRPSSGPPRVLGLFGLLFCLGAAGCGADGGEEEPDGRALDPEAVPVVDTTDPLTGPDAEPADFDGDPSGPDAEPGAPGTDRTAEGAGADAAAPGPGAPADPEEAEPPAGPGADTAAAGPGAPDAAPAPDEGAPAPADGGIETYEGRVVISGAVPTTFPALEREGGSLVLAGDLSDELRRLTGARVRVRGTASGQGPGRTLRVSAYEILQIDGSEPRVGIVVRESGGLRLHEESGEVLPLEGAPASLQRHVGAKVWIVGPEEEGALRIRSYGVIRPDG